MSAIWAGVTAGLITWCCGWIVTGLSQVHAIDKCTGKEYGWNFPVAVAALLVVPVVLAFVSGASFGKDRG